MWRAGVALLGVLGIVEWGCSEEIAALGTTVHVAAQLAAAVVRQSTMEKRAVPQGQSEVDSLEVTSVRILLKRLKLHTTGDTSLQGEEVKVGPFVAVFAHRERQLAVSTIPPATYRRLKLEFHRLTDEEVSRYANDSLLWEFATPERYSVSIEGRVFTPAGASAFIYRSDVTANVALPLEPPAEVRKEQVLSLLLHCDPYQIFVVAGRLVDPRDERNRRFIDSNLHMAFKVLKRTI